MSPPPDLSQCTELEVVYLPSALRCFSSPVRDEHLFNAEELQHLESLERIVVRERQRIQAFAKTVASGTYYGPAVVLGVRPMARILGRCEDKHTPWLEVYDFDIMTEDNHRFEYPGTGFGRRRGPLMGNVLKLTPQVVPFEHRVWCADNLSYLAFYGDLRGKKVEAYPASSIWCDALVRHQQDKGFSVQYFTRRFKCPGGGEGPCHYAMNPNCTPDSPEDMVLLFETKAGWNQHGGPELFTLDNHNPKGGCVLLNDRTVKFIRTEEELHALRWN